MDYLSRSRHRPGGSLRPAAEEAARQQKNVGATLRVYLLMVVNVELFDCGDRFNKEMEPLGRHPGFLTKM